MSIERILDMLERATKGPICTAKQWNTRVLPEAVSRKLKEHGLYGTCTPENPVNTEDELADEFFKAGFELALEIGLICQDTERVIKLTEEEIKNALSEASSELHLGSGADRVVLKHRKPEEKHPPLCTAPTAVVFPEEKWVPFMRAVAQYREIDILSSASLVTVFGHRVLAGTPYETILGWYEAKLTREALSKAGRPGMCKIGIVSSPTEYGQLGGFGTVGGLAPAGNIAMILTPGAMMTSYSAFHKVINAITCGASIYMASNPMIGGYSGPPEGAALTHIAMSLFNVAVHQGQLIGGSPVDIRYFGNSGREGQWAHSVARQAASRNTHYLGVDMQHQVGGPCTEMLLYEDAVTMMQVSASGAAGAIATRSTGVRYAEHLSPLECKFSAEVLKRSAGMTRKEVNQIAKVLIPKYENMLRDPPKGKSCDECYDLKTLKPTKEYLDLYLKVKKELIELGVPLDEHL